MRILSSAEKCRRVCLKMSRTICSAEAFAGNLPGRVGASSSILRRYGKVPTLLKSQPKSVPLVVTEDTLHHNNLRSTSRHTKMAEFANSA
jgi:hypothetical protein